MFRNLLEFKTEIADFFLEYEINYIQTNSDTVKPDKTESLGFIKFERLLSCSA